MAFAITAGWCTFAAAQSLDERIDQIATPLAEDRVFYRWQSTASGENLARLGTLNASTNAHFMSVKDGISAGTGLYVAGTPSSSASYLPAEGGNLLEVRIAKGTRVVDLTDAATVRKMRELNMRDWDIKGAAGLDGSVLVQYDDDWFVGKNLTDRAHFQLYPDPRRTNEEILAHFRSIDEGPSQKQLMKQVGHASPERLAALLQRPDAIDVALRVGPRAEAPDHLRRYFARDVPPDRGLTVWKQVMEDPKLFATVRADLGLRARLVRDATHLMEWHALHEAPVTRTSMAFFKVLKDEPALGTAERNFVRSSLVDGYLNDAALRRAPEHLAQKLRPLLDGLKLTARQRDHIRGETAQILTKLEDAVLNPAGLSQIRRLAGIDDPDFQPRVDHLARRATAIESAVAEGSNEALRAALGQSRTLGELIAAMERLEYSLPSSRVDDALIDYVRYHGREYRALIQSEADLQSGLNLAQRQRSALLQDHTYRAALEMPPAARAKYLAQCLDHAGCRDNLAFRITKDRGAMVKGIEDFTEVVRALEGARPPRERLYAALLDHAPPNALLKAIGREVLPDGLSPQSRKLIFDRVRALDPRELRTGTLIWLHHLAAGDPATARDLLRTAIAAAAHPDDLVDVGTLLTIDRRANLSLSTTFSRRLTELGANATDLAHVRGLKLAGALPPPVASRECLTELARLVRP